MSNLTGRVALVTGGASGIGAAIAARLVADGALVVISDVQEELGSGTAHALGARFAVHDVTDEVAWSKVISSIEDEHGRLDILVNNAGILGQMQAVSPEDTPLADWRRLFAVNLDGVFLGCRAAIPVMARASGGAIVNVASIAGLMASPHATAYGCTKAAVRQLTKSVAQHCANRHPGIRCNSVHPGVVRTPLWDAQARDEAVRRGIPYETVVEEATALVPSGRLTTPEDVAAAVAFLVSADAMQINGAKLVVDGGTLLRLSSPEQQG